MSESDLIFFLKKHKQSALMLTMISRFRLTRFMKKAKQEIIKSQLNAKLFFKKANLPPEFTVKLAEESWISSFFFCTPETNEKHS